MVSKKSLAIWSNYNFFLVSFSKHNNEEVSSMLKGFFEELVDLIEGLFFKIEEGVKLPQTWKNHTSATIGERQPLVLRF